MPVRALLACLLLTVAAVGCADASPDGDELAAPTARALAEGAERLAHWLEAGDDCAAAAESDVLVERVREGIDDGTVPARVAGEVEAVLDDIDGHVRCDADSAEPAPPPSPPAPSDAPDPAPAPRGEPDDAAPQLTGAR